MLREGSDIIQLRGDSVNIQARELRTLDDGVGGGGGGSNSLRGSTVTVVSLRSTVGGSGGDWTRDVPAVAVLHDIIAGGGVDVRGRGMVVAVALVLVVCFPERVCGVDSCRTYHMFPFS